MKKQLLSLLVVMALLLAPILDAAKVYAEPNQANIKDTISQVLSKVSPSVVGIIGKVKQDKYNSMYGQYAPFGTGVIFRQDGFIITNSHVVAEMSDIVVVLSDGKAYKAELQLSDEKCDLAILKINKTGLAPAEFGDMADISVGETVIAIGTPMSFSLRNSATMGIISGLNRAASGDYKFIQSDVAINGGNSGGPLVNTKGKVIGINSVKMTGYGVEGLSFSIPVDTIKYIISQYDRFGKVRRPSLGAELAEGVAATYGLPSNEGLTITKLEKDSPAQKAGMAIDDIITAINGVKLTSLVDYNEETKKYLPGDAVDFTVDRNGSSVNIKVIFDEVKDTGKQAASEESGSAEGYSTGPDGALNDLSFLVGGIGNTKIGHSYYGWSMNVPKSSQIISESFNSRNLVITNQPRKLTFIINANPVIKNWTLKQYFDNIKDQDSYYGKLVDSKIIEDSNPKYAELLYTMDRSGSALRRLYINNGFIYSVALLSEESNPKDLMADEYCSSLINSFKLDYKGGVGVIKDISKVVNGQVEYTNYEMQSNYEKLKTWQMSFRPDWKQLTGQPYRQFRSRFGANEKECIEVSINSLEEGQDLDSYCRQLQKQYSEEYNPNSYRLMEAKTVDINGSKAYKLVHLLKIGKTKYVYDDNYIIYNGLMYRLRLNTTFDKYSAYKESYYKMLNTFKPDTDDIEKLRKAVEDSEIAQSSDGLGKDERLTDYQNKKQPWSIKLPGNWIKRNVYSASGNFEGYFSPDNQMGLYINSYDNSKEKSRNKYNVDDKNVLALDFLQIIINNAYKKTSSYSDDDYLYESDAYSVFDTVVTESDYSTNKKPGIVDDALADMLDKYDGSAGENNTEIKKRQLAANEAAGKKFNSKTVFKDKEVTVTAYTYAYKDESEDIDSTVQIYVFEKGKNIYLYASVLSYHLASAKNTQLLKDIWSSFKFQQL